MILLLKVKDFPLEKTYKNNGLPCQWNIERIVDTAKKKGEKNAKKLPAATAGQIPENGKLFPIFERSLQIFRPQIRNPI